MSNYRIETKCVQSGYEPGNGEPRVLPIYQSTTFKYDNSEEMAMLFDLKKEGYFYSRLQNPTNDAVAKKIAQLEGGVGAVLTSSGQAANFYAVSISHPVAITWWHPRLSTAGPIICLPVTMKKMGVEFTFVSPHATEEELDAYFDQNEFVAYTENTMVTKDELVPALTPEAFAERTTPRLRTSTLTTSNWATTISIWTTISNIEGSEAACLN